MDTSRTKPDTIAAQALGWVDDKTRAVIPIDQFGGCQSRILDADRAEP